MRTVSRHIAILLALASCGGLAGRDNPLDPHYRGPRGTVMGKVVLRSGTALQLSETDNQVKVDFSGIRVGVPEIRSVRAVQSTADGTYRLSGIPVGVWRVTFSAPGYVTASVAEVLVRANHETVLETININEAIQGKLLFGSSRTGSAALFVTDPYGQEVTALSSLPVQANSCSYGRVGKQAAVAFDSDFAVRKDGNRYETGAGVIVVSYPQMDVLGYFPRGTNARRPIFIPDGKLLLHIESGSEKYLAKVRPDQMFKGASLEEFRITGTPDDAWAESSAAVSPSGRIAYVRYGQAPGSDLPLYEIRLADGSEEGELVFHQDLLDIIDRVGRSSYFDFDGNGTDDLGKFGTLLTVLGVGGTYFAGVDWSADLTLDMGSPNVADDARAYLQGPKPDGIAIDPYQIILELLQMSTVWNLGWLPDEKSLFYTDRLLSQPALKRRLLSEIKNNLAPITESTGAGFDVIRATGSGRTTDYYYDINANGVYDYAADKPFFYEDPSTYIDLFTLEQLHLERQTLQKLPLLGKTKGQPAPFFVADVDMALFEASASADGRRIAFAMGPAQSLFAGFNYLPFLSHGDILTVDPASGFVTRVTTDRNDNRAPCWVP